MINKFLIFIIVITFIVFFIKAVYEMYKKCKTMQEIIFDRLIREQIRDYWKKTRYKKTRYKKTIIDNEVNQAFQCGRKKKWNPHSLEIFKEIK
jgi:hypothetical protein